MWWQERTRQKQQAWCGPEGGTRAVPPCDPTVVKARSIRGVSLAAAPTRERSPRNNVDCDPSAIERHPSGRTKRLENPMNY